MRSVSVPTLCAAAVALCANSSASLVSAAPALAERSLIERTLQTPFSGFPACNTRDTDPTWAVSQSAFTDGEGHYLGSDCDNNSGGSNHCWTDYYLVGTTAAYNPWYEAISNIQCPPNSTGSCSEAVTNLQQSCTSFTWNAGVTISSDAKIELAEILSIGTSVSISGNVGAVYQTCNSNSNTATCTFTDGGCHTIWASQLINTVHGYKRRSCNSPTSDTSANMPNTAKRSDGYYTRGMQDYEFPLVGISAITCDGTCESTYQPGQLPVPVNNGGMVPWPSS
jgi:hypothetical protein